jgi:hypothetical protein
MIISLNVAPVGGGISRSNLPGFPDDFRGYFSRNRKMSHKNDDPAGRFDGPGLEAVDRTAIRSRT